MNVRSRFATVLVPLTLALVVTIAPAATPVDGGTWTKKGYAIDGGWRIVDDAGTLYVELDASFSTRRAPDLKLFLSPLELGALGDRNAIRDAVLIAPLEHHKGAQRYALPDGVDLGAYRSLIVHCEKFSKLWGGTALDHAE